MSRRAIVAILVFTALIIFLIIYKQQSTCKCEDRISYESVFVYRNIDADSLFKPVTEKELTGIRNSWAAFNPASDSFAVIDTMTYSRKRRLYVIKHYYGGKKHYGALIFPAHFDSLTSYPLLLWANGLNQKNPAVDFYKNGNAKGLIHMLEDYFICIPSYRGQALVVFKERYCSDGFFGDAYAGATDDALRLLHLVKSEFKGIDLKRIAVYGESRGANVALLMASRDSTLNAVACAAAPTDFLTKKAYYKYGVQYTYQFLSRNKPLSQIRRHIIKSSPCYFIDSFQNDLLLIHGRYDQTVDVEHAEKVIAKLKSHKNFESEIQDIGHYFKNMNKIAIWLREKN